MELTVMETREVQKKNKKRRGFTLIEMVVVIAIIAIIAGIAIPQALKAINKSKVTSDIANGKSIASAISQVVAEGGVMSVETGVITDVTAAADKTALEQYLNPMPKVKRVTNSDNTKVGFSYSYNKVENKLVICVKDDADYYEIYPEVSETAVTISNTGAVTAVANKKSPYASK